MKPTFATMAMNKTCVEEPYSVLPEPSQDVKKVSKLKLKVILGIVIAFLIAAVVIVVAAFAFFRISQTNITIAKTKVVHVTVPSMSKNINIFYNFQEKDKIVFIHTKTLDGIDVYGIRDYNKRAEAFKIPLAEVCIIGKLEDNDDFNINSDQSNNMIPVNDTQQYAIVNDTIYPTILEMAAGEYIVRFCENYQPMWFLPYEEVYDTGYTSDDETTTTSTTDSTEENDHTTSTDIFESFEASSATESSAETKNPMEISILNPRRRRAVVIVPSHCVITCRGVIVQTCTRSCFF